VKPAGAITRQADNGYDIGWWYWRWLLQAAANFRLSWMYSGWVREWLFKEGKKVLAKLFL